MKRNLIRLSVLCLLVLGLFAFASPSLLAQAATVRKVTAYCSRATVSGRVEQPARYVQITVAPASNLSQTIVKVYARVQPGRNYSKSFSYAAQQSGTRLIFAICESDGSKCLRPATMVGANCRSEGATPTPTAIPPTPTPIPTTEPTLPPTPEPTLPPTPEPTLPPTPEPTLPPTPGPLAIQSVQFWPDVPNVDRYSTFDFGARINFESTIITRAHMLAFFTYQGQELPSESTCMGQQMPGRSGEVFWSTGMTTELAPGTNSFERSYVFSDTSAPNDATHLVMWLMLEDANNRPIACWQKVIELSSVSP